MRLKLVERDVGEELRELEGMGHDEDDDDKDVAAAATPASDGLMSFECRA